MNLNKKQLFSKIVWGVIAEYPAKSFTCVHMLWRTILIQWDANGWARFSTVKPSLIPCLSSCWVFSLQYTTYWQHVEMMWRWRNLVSQKTCLFAATRITWFNSSLYFIRIKGPNETILGIEHVEFYLLLRNFGLACFILWPKFPPRYIL